MGTSLLHILPILIVVRCAFNALCVQVSNHVVETASPHLLEPCAVTEPLYQCGADSVIDVDECAAIPCFRERVVAETAERPDLRAVVGAVNDRCNVAAAL